MRNEDRFLDAAAALCLGLLVFVLWSNGALDGAPELVQAWFAYLVDFIKGTLP